MANQPEDQSFVPDENVSAEGVQPHDVQREDVDGGAETVADLEREAGDELASDIESLQVELEEAQQRALRLQAELENYRKRAQRSIDEERRYASLPLMRELLTVVDNLHRATAAAQQNDEAAGLLEGVEMVAGQLTNILKQHHCEEIVAEGTRFDPNLHEAIAQFPSDEHEPGEVSQVTQVGYQLHGRVIRPAQVIVAAPRVDAE